MRTDVDVDDFHAHAGVLKRALLHKGKSVIEQIKYMGRRLTAGNSVVEVVADRFE